MTITARRASPRPGIGRRRLGGWLRPTAILAISIFLLAPIYLIAISAVSSPTSLFDFPRPFLPDHPTPQTLQFFLGFEGVVPAFLNSLIVGLVTVLLSLLLGVPAGYALARYDFAGKDLIQSIILGVRAFPVIVLAIPLAVSFLGLGLYDTLLGVALVHTAFSLPLTILVTASVFLRVQVELEEAAMSLGCSRLRAFRHVVLPLSLPGLAAAAMFAFVYSWNEYYAATILTLHNRTLPALLLSSLTSSPLYFQFAGGLALTAPAFLFLLVMRPYLSNMFGGVRR